MFSSEHSCCWVRLRRFWRISELVGSRKVTKVPNLCPSPAGHFSVVRRRQRNATSSRLFLNTTTMKTTAKLLVCLSISSSSYICSAFSTRPPSAITPSTRATNPRCAPPFVSPLQIQPSRHGSIGPLFSSSR